MHWMRRVRKELLAYNALRANRQEIIELIDGMDKDISPRASRLDDMPRIKMGLPSSPVESTAIHREETLEVITIQLEDVEKRISSMEKALQALDQQELEVIRLCFHRVDEPDEGLAEQLGISEYQFESIKYYAMLRVYRFLEH